MNCFGVLFLFSLYQTIHCTAIAYFKPNQGTFGMGQGGAGVMCANGRFCFVLFNVYLFLRETETQSVSGRESEREGDIESEVGSRL